MKKTTAKRIGTGLAVGALAVGLTVGTANAFGARDPGTGMQSQAPGMRDGMGATGCPGGQLVEATHRAVAKYLGLTGAQLTDKMHSGQTLADIAEEQGKDVDGLVDVMVARMARNLDRHPNLTAEQKQQRLQWMRSRIQQMIETGHGMGSRSGMGTMMGDGPAAAGMWRS